MHEMAICETIVALITTEAKKRGLTQVRRVTLHVGKMAAFKKEQLLIFLKGIPQKKLLTKTSFKIKEIPVTLECKSCEAQQVDTRFDDLSFAHRIAHAPEFYQPLPCPKCGATDAKIVSGKEQEVLEIE